MATKVTKNVFAKGMNLDADITYQPQGTYNEANEVRLSVDSNSTMGTLINVKGNSLEIDSFTGSIVGTISTDDGIVLITKYDDGSGTEYNNIYKVSITEEVADTPELLWSDSGKSTDDKLNIETEYIIKGVYRKEAEDVKKIYWIDDNNYLRYANIEDYLTTDGLVKSSSNEYMSAKKFGTVSSVTFTNPVLKSSGGGGLDVGCVQYAYQLYNENGSETSFSPATGLYHLSSSSDSSSNSSSYKGNAAEDESGKSFTFQISLDTYEYDKIRVVSIHYEDYSGVPTISTITETTINSEGVVTFTDTGGDYIDTYTVEEFTALAGLYKAKDIASSKNYLFIANVTENYFNIDDYDARAYRFNAGSTVTARLEESTSSDGYLYFVYYDGSWDYMMSDGTVVESGTDWELPSDANCINLYNNTAQDTNRLSATDADTRNDYLGNFKYDVDGNIGGTGKNISYQFETYDFEIDDGSYPYRISTEDRAVFRDDTDTEAVGYAGYCSPYVSANLRSYQRSEIYRFAIVFFDEYGRESVASWIGDIRIPDMRDSNFSYISDGEAHGSIIYPVFTVSDFPDGAVSCKIIRVERDTDDRSIVVSGIIRPTIYQESTANNGPFHPKWADDVEQKTDLQELISPEVSFYKEFSIKDEDYLEIFDLDGSSVMFNPEKDGGIITTSVTEDVSIKYSDISSPSDRYTTTVYDGEIVGLMEKEESTTINTIGYSGFFLDTTGDDEEGYKGTSLILSTYNNDWSYSSTEHYAKYAVYRKDVTTSRYGGIEYSDRALNEYISCSDIYTLSSDSSTELSASIGDTFINMMEHQALYYSDDGESVFLNYLFPVESSINLNLRYDDSFTKVFQQYDDSYKSIKEDGDADEDLSALYLYNTVYSQENTVKTYYPLSENEDPVDTKTFNTRVLVSEKKYNDEESDSWLNFLSNNYIDVDANYGDLNNIMDYNNNLLFWQSNAFGIIDIDSRALLSDTDAGALVLGTGTLLSRFDYLSTMTGNTDDFGIYKTPRGIYWFDNINNTIVKYQGKSIERLSKLYGIQSYLNNKKYTDSLVSYFPKYDEVLFSLSNSSGLYNKTLVFNELTNTFTSFYGYDPIRYVNHKNITFSTDNSGELWLHDSDTSSYGIYYGQSTPNQSTIKIPINADIDIIKVFDNINFTSYVTDDDDILIYDQTFDSIRFYNSYQNSDYITLTPGTNIDRKKGMWSMCVSRNALNVDPSTNPDIFDSDNLDQTQTFKPRMRDTYMFIDLIYDNTNDYKFKFPFIHTKYRANYR